MRIVGLHHAQITIPTGAEAKARDFYCNLLGLPEIEKPDSLKSRGGFWLNVRDREVHVGAEDKPDATLTKAHLAYEVDDIEAYRITLTKNGFILHDGEPISGYTRFETRDPFGNRIEFIQPVG